MSPLKLPSLNSTTVQTESFRLEKNFKIIEFNSISTIFLPEKSAPCELPAQPSVAAAPALLVGDCRKAAKDD